MNIIMMFEWQRGKMIVSLLLIVFDLVFSHGSRLMWICLLYHLTLPTRR